MEGLNASSTNNTSSLARLPTCSPTTVLSGKIPANCRIPLLPFGSPTSTRRKRNLCPKSMESASMLNTQQGFRLGPVAKRDQRSWQGPPDRKENNNKISGKWERRLAMQTATKLAKHDLVIVDLGASGCYFTTDAPVSNVNKTAAKIRVGTATGQAQTSEVSCELPLPDLPSCLFRYIMYGFTHNLFGIGNLCDKDCKVLFKKHSVIIYDRNNQPFLK